MDQHIGSLEETRDVIAESQELHPFRIAASLYLLVQVQEFGLPVIAAVNMMDEATSRGIHIDFEQLGHYLGDPVVTTAIVDRMIHNAVVLSIDGPSWRLKQSREHNKKMREQNAPGTSTPERPKSSAKAGKSKD